MAFDLSQIGPLASAVEKAGAPILAQFFRTVAPIAVSEIPVVGPFLAPLAGTVIDGIAAQYGVSASDAGALTSAIANDPNAGVKIQAIEDEHKDALQSALDFARLQADQNAAYLKMGAGFWQSFFWAGARPLEMFLSGPLLTLYLYAAAFHLAPPMDPTTFAILSGRFALLAGLRSSDKTQGVASPAPVIPPPVKRLLARKVAK